MRQMWRRVWHDLKNRRHVDVYAASLVTLVLASVTLVSDVVPDQLRWATLLAGSPHLDAWPTKIAMPSMMRCRPNLKERAGSWAAPYSAPAAAPTRTAVG
jgi:hypothetical protein